MLFASTVGVKDRSVLSAIKELNSHNPSVTHAALQKILAILMLQQLLLPQLLLLVITIRGRVSIERSTSSLKSKEHMLKLNELIK